jgi:succinyl-diaminopimelate desuccinylase
MVNSHIDVVPGPDRIFSPITKGKFIYGRGSADTKSAVAVMLNLNPEIIKLSASKNILFSLVSDEEIGGGSTKEFISQSPNLEFGIFGEPTGLKIENQAKGIMQIQITASGKSAHGSRPWNGKNAIEAQARNLTAFFSINSSPKKETTKTTYNFSQIKGGTAINQIPDRCELLLDVRYHPDDQPKSILRLLTQHFPQTQIVALKTESPIYTDPKHPKITVLKKCLSQFGIKPELIFEHGSSDARHCTAKRISSVVFGPLGKNLHQENEYVDASSLPLYQSVLENFINTW